MADSAAPHPVPLKRVRPDEVKALSLSPIDDKTLAQAGAIMKEVREGGEPALISIGERFGDLKSGALEASVTGSLRCLTMRCDQSLLLTPFLRTARPFCCCNRHKSYPPLSSRAGDEYLIGKAEMERVFNSLPEVRDRSLALAPEATWELSSIVTPRCALPVTHTGGIPRLILAG